MPAPQLPAAFALLYDDANVAVDAALVEVLPYMQPDAQDAALSLLGAREHSPSLAAVAVRFAAYPADLQRRVLHRARDLAAGLHQAILSPLYDQRASAIELIVRSDACRLAYLLDEALRSRDPRTRETAAAGLYQMTVSWLRRREASATAPGRECLAVEAASLAEAVSSAVRRWESHLQPRVLDAALLLGDRVESTLHRKLTEPRCRIGRNLQIALASANHVDMAGALLRAVAVPDLRASAAQAVLRGAAGDMLRRLLLESWLLADPRVERGCRWIHYRPWAHDAARLVPEMDASAIGGAVRLLASIGGPHDRRLAVLKEVAESTSVEAREAVVWQLLHDPTDPATDLLTVIAGRPGDAAARIAEREVCRRRGRAIPAEASPRRAAVGEGGEALAELWDKFWSQFDDPNLDGPAQAEIFDAVRGRAADVVDLLAAKFASGEPLNRIRALRVAAGLALVRQMEAWICRAAFDPDPVVRSIAVSMVCELEGPSARRILERAIDDPDDRVQSAAIEAVDRLGLPDRPALLETKLDSQHPRVRANAVKSLLRLEHPRAADGLLTMLEDQVSAHRLSGLWVVEKLRLLSLRTRVEQLAALDPDRRVRRRAEHVLAVFRREAPPAPRRPRGGWSAKPMTPSGSEEA